MLIRPADFDRLRAFLESRTGIQLEDGKSYLAESRLASIVDQHRLGDLAGLLRRLPSDRGLEQEVINALTTNETSFFRDHRPFTLLRTEILPPLMERAQQGNEVAIWSAACSTGQEAYSVAMVVREEWPSLTDKVRIVGTDLNPEVVDRAKQGRYSQIEVNRGLAPDLLGRHFRRVDGQYEVVRDVQRMVSFRPHNLLDGYYGPPFDVVLCRNVLIYSALPTRHRILQRIARAMRPQGWLMVGTSEHGSVPVPPFRSVMFPGIQVFRLQDAR
ncbi:MAG: CheR family methyltransferase [Myxococcota bacterium]